MLKEITQDNPDKVLHIVFPLTPHLQESSPNLKLQKQDTSVSFDCSKSPLLSDT